MNKGIGVAAEECSVSFILIGAECKDLSQNRSPDPRRIIMIMVALKGTIHDFYSLLNGLKIVSSTHAQVARAQTCANHVQHTELLPRATCRVPRSTKEQLSY